MADSCATVGSQVNSGFPYEGSHKQEIKFSYLISHRTLAVAMASCRRVIVWNATRRKGHVREYPLGGRVLLQSSSECTHSIIGVSSFCLLARDSWYLLECQRMKYPSGFTYPKKRKRDSWRSELCCEMNYSQAKIGRTHYHIVLLNNLEGSKRTINWASCSNWQK